MQKMSGIELSFVASELAPLQGKRIARIRKTPQGVYLFKIGTEEMLFEPGVRLHLTRQVQQATDAPDGFVALLRKQLEGKTAEKIAQYGTDRILEVTTRSKERLVFELFRKGNLIYVGEDGKIIACLEKEEAGGRKIARGEPYSYPPATSFVPKLPEKHPSLCRRTQRASPSRSRLTPEKAERGSPRFQRRLTSTMPTRRSEAKGRRPRRER